jgi:hypothetical protein
VQSKRHTTGLQHIWHRLLGQRKAAVLLALFAQGVVILGCLLVVVVLPEAPAPTEFEATVSASAMALPERSLQARAASRSRQLTFASASLPPIALEALSLEQPELNLPEVPDFTNSVALSPLHTDGFLPSTGHSQWADPAWQPGRFQFLGIEESATRIVIAFDVSRGMLTSLSRTSLDLDDVVARTETLIEQLDGRSAVNLIQFVRRFETFSPYPVPATAQNKARLVGWLRQNLVRSGRSPASWQRPRIDGIQAVLEAAFQSNPDVLFLLSDGRFYRTPSGRVPWDSLAQTLKRLQKARAEPVRVHGILFGPTPADLQAMRQLLRPYSGTVTQVTRAETDP